MGVVANAALAAGGKVIGIIPRAMVAEERDHRGLTELIVVETMHERKNQMAELADAFVALPGGIGTLEEMVEVFTWLQLGLHSKPVGVLNAAGFYELLLQFLTQLRDQGFLTPEHHAKLTVASDVELLLDALVTAKHVHLPKPIEYARPVSMSTTDDPTSLVKHERPVIAIALFDGVEVLDFAGPYEVFAAARNESGEPYTRVFTVGDEPEIKCHGGLRVIPDAPFEKCPDFDVLIIPGGPGARELRNSQRTVIRFIKEQRHKVKLIASVCTGAFLVARAGLLDGRRATTHSNRLKLFADEFPAVTVEKRKLIDEGDIITVGGISSGVDLALYLLERWFGADARRHEALRLDGPW